MTAYEQSEAAAEAEEMAQKEEENSSGISGVMSELALKAGEADSAASGLKKVTREQQTWRKEFKREEVAPPPAQSHPKKPFSPKAKTKKAPVCEFIASSQKWLIENQQNDSFSASKPLTIDITDAKQQAYIYNCHNVNFPQRETQNDRDGFLSEVQSCFRYGNVGVRGCQLPKSANSNQWCVSHVCRGQDRRVFGLFNGRGEREGCKLYHQQE